MVYVPMLKWAGLPLIEDAIPLGLLRNGLNTLLALIPYARKKLIDGKGDLAMADGAVAVPLRKLLGPIRLEPIQGAIGRPFYRAHTSIQTLAYWKKAPSRGFGAGFEYIALLEAAGVQPCRAWDPQSQEPRAQPINRFWGSVNALSRWNPHPVNSICVETSPPV